MCLNNNVKTTSANISPSNSYSVNNSVCYIFNIYSTEALIDILNKVIYNYDGKIVID